MVISLCFFTFIAIVSALFFLLFRAICCVFINIDSYFGERFPLLSFMLFIFVVVSDVLSEVYRDVIDFLFG